MRTLYHDLKYNYSKDGLKEEHRLKIVPYCRIYNEIFLQYITRMQLKKDAFNFLEKHLIESKQEVERHWKNVKFVIFDYESADLFLFNNNSNVLNKANVEKLEKDGFIVIKTSDLTDIKLGDGYWLGQGDSHPNEAAWDLITPLFVKKLQEYK